MRRKWKIGQEIERIERNGKRKLAERGRYGRNEREKKSMRKNYEEKGGDREGEREKKGMEKVN